MCVRTHNCRLQSIQMYKAFWMKVKLFCKCKYPNLNKYSSFMHIFKFSYINFMIFAFKRLPPQINSEMHRGVWDSFHSVSLEQIHKRKQRSSPLKKLEDLAILWISALLQTTQTFLFSKYTKKKKLSPFTYRSYTVIYEG